MIISINRIYNTSHIKPFKTISGIDIEKTIKQISINLDSKILESSTFVSRFRYDITLSEISFQIQADSINVYEKTKFN